MININRFTIVVKQDDYSFKLADNLKKRIVDIGFIFDPDNPDIVVSVGGDGTFLRAVHTFIDVLEKVVFISLRSGTLGFYTDYKDNEIDLLVNDLTNLANSSICQMPLLKAEINNKVYYALNEIRIENNIKTLTIDVEVDDQYLEKYRGNGMIICTPSGSTAYNRSLGGPIIDHVSEVFALTEVAGIHHNAYRALGSTLILAKDRVLKLHVANFVNNILGIDHLLIDETNIKEVVVTMAKRYVRILRFQKNTFIPRIRSTLVEQ